MTHSSSMGLGDGCAELSVVIPTFNCAAFLEQTLRSLVQQGDQIRSAEILILDDCSTKDDPELVARKVWGNRVKFFRHPRNVGPIANFNACASRADRSWIHILHGDDIVLPGAYAAFQECIDRNPGVQAVYGRVLDIDKDGVWTSLPPLYGKEAFGILRYDPYAWSNCLVQFAGVVFSKDALHKVGIFDEAFCHVADWNLWWRIARGSLVGYTNTCVGGYRVFEGNHTSTLKRSGRNILERIDQLTRITRSIEEDGGQVDRQRLFSGTFDMLLDQAARYLDDTEAYTANNRIFRQIPMPAKRVVPLARLRLRRLKRVLRGMISAPRIKS